MLWYRIVLPALLGLAWCAGVWAATPKVAVLAEPGMPYFMADPALDPQQIVRAFQACGLPAEALTARDVATPARFSSRRYAALVIPYGNTFPLPIADPVTRYHREGGSLVSFGVPFTHPCEPAGPLGWSLYSSENRNPVVRDQDRPRSGRHSLRIERRGAGPATWTGCASERFRAREGERFIVSAWTRTAGSFGAQDCLYVRFFGAGGRFLGQTGPAFPNNAVEWTPMRQVVTAPAGTRTVDVCAALFTTATTWLDDVSLAREGSPRQNLLRDGGFEGMLAGLWSDTGHSEAYRKHDATGAGEFAVVQGCEGLDASAAPRWLGLPPAAFRDLTTPNAVCVADFPEDEVVGIVGPTRGGRVLGYSTAIIRHRCAPFRGAVDLYASTQMPPPDLSTRLVVAGTARVLRERGLIDEATMRRVQDRAARWQAPPAPIVALPPRPKTWSGIFPKPLPPARELFLVDLSSLAAPERLMFTALQGLLNRPVPRVYAEDEWSADLRAWGHTLTPIEPWDLLRRFRGQTRGVVVYDPSLPATANVAVTLCALEGWLPVHPSQLADVGPKGREISLPVKADLRGRWRTEAEAYAWALRHLRPRCTSRVVCHEKQMEPLTPDAPLVALTIVDYVVQQRIFSFHLNRSWSAEDRRVAERILASYPANVPVIGHFGPEANGAPNLANEAEVVDLASRYAKFFVFLVSHNASVHAGFPTRPLKQRRPPTPPLDRGKVYVAPYLSDGDSPTTWYHGRARWADPARGRIPIAWSLGPASLELYPRAIEWFYRHASDNDCFVAACSGAGYCYPHVYGQRIRGRDAAIRQFLKLTDGQMRRADLSITHIHHVSNCTAADIDRYAREVTCLRGVLADYSRVVPGYAQSHRLSEGRVPVFHALTGFWPPATGTLPDQWVRELKEMTPAERPAFLHFFAVLWFSNPTDIAETLKNLDPETYVPVRPDALADLYRSARHAPGR